MTNEFYLVIFLFLSLAVSSVVTVVTASTTGGARHFNERDEVTGHIKSSAEEILAQRQQRKEEFTLKLDEFKQQLEEHHNGEGRRLNEHELNRINRKIKAYETKVEQLSKDIGDRHIDRLLDREELLNEMHRSRVERSEL